MYYNVIIGGFLDTNYLTLTAMCGWLRDIHTKAGSKNGGGAGWCDCGVCDCEIVWEVWEGLCGVCEGDEECDEKVKI